MLHLESRFKKYWDLGVLATTIGTALIIPFSVVFGTTGKPVPIIATVLSTLVFIADVILSFNTSFNYQGKVIQGKKAIALRYLKGWCGIDLIADKFKVPPQ